MDDFPPEVVMRILGLLDPWWVGVASQVSPDLFTAQP